MQRHDGPALRGVDAREVGLRRGAREIDPVARTDARERTGRQVGGEERRQLERDDDAGIGARCGHADRPDADPRVLQDAVAPQDGFESRGCGRDADQRREQTGQDRRPVQRTPSGSTRRRSW